MAEVIPLFGSSAEVIAPLITGEPPPPKKRPKRPTPKEIRSKIFPAVFRREYPVTPAWLVDCYINGKSTNKTIGPVAKFTEFEACRRGQEIIQAIHEGRNPFIGDMSFEVYYDDVRTPWARANKRSAEDEIGVFNRYIRRRLGHLLMRQLRAHHFQALVDDYMAGTIPTARRKTLGKGTIYQIIATYLAVTNWAYRRGDLAENPTRGIRQIKLNNARHARYSAAELAAIGVQLQRVSPLLRLLFTMLLASGRRISELLHARHDDVDEVAKTLLIRDTKAGGDFLLPGTPEFMAAYEELKQYAIPGNPHLFPSKKGIGAIAAPYGQFRKMLADAGITERRVFHDTRRTMGSEAISLGISLIDVARSLDHADTTITAKHYVITEHERIRSTLTKTSALLGAMLNRDSQAQIKLDSLKPSVLSIRISNDFTFVVAGGRHA
jgi:integrase